MAPFVRKHRKGLRGWLLALTVWITGELMLAATEVKRRAKRTP